MNRLAVAAFAALPTLSVAPPASAQVQVLTTPLGWTFRTSAISSNGTIVAGSASHPVLGDNVGPVTETGR